MSITTHNAAAGTITVRTSNRQRGLLSTQHQGTCIVEPSLDGGYLVMTPDGVVERRRSEAQVLALARRYGRQNMNGANVGLLNVEWRGCGPALRQRAR